jgi:hypothetical protein
MPFALKPRTPRGPLVDFLPNALGRFFGRLPTGPRGAEIRARAQDARTDLLAALDPAACGHHAFRIHLAGRERRRDAVAEEDERVGGVLVDASRAEQVDRVVRV